MKRTRGIRILGLGLALFLLLGCQPVTPEDDLNGRITIWHSWSGQDAVVLREMLDRFQEIHPNVRVVDLGMPADQILAEFKDAAQNGLAPGVVIGQDGWIRELVQEGLIREFPVNAATSILTSSRNRALVEYEGKVYGLPLFLSPRALFYNKELVSEPSRTLDELLQNAAAGNRVEIVPRFEEAYWGIRPFGNGLFDVAGRLILKNSGFEEWLAWLDEAQNSQGMILSIDEESLLELFVGGQTAYLVSGPDSMNAIASRIDDDNPLDYGVVPLPSGPSGPSGPLSKAETMLFYVHASPAQERIANELAAFLSNERQGIQFVRDLNKTPANPRISVDSRIYPHVSGFAQQARTTVSLPNEWPVELLINAGNRAYTSVLSGSTTPSEAVCQFGKELIASDQIPPESVVLPEGCEPVTSEP